MYHREERRRHARFLWSVDALRYRLTPTRRAYLESAITTQLQCNLPLGHPVIVEWDRVRTAYADRQIVHIAKTQRVRRWRTVWERCQIWQSLDVTEYVVAEVVLTRRYLPACLRARIGVGLAYWAAILRQAREVPVSVCTPVICSYVRAMTPGCVIKICARELGTVRVAWWRQRPEVRAGPSLFPWLRVAFQVGLVVILVASIAWPDVPRDGVVIAAISVNSVFEVRTAGNDTNGGGFVTGAAGTDYSQQDANNTVGADISTTDAVAAGTTTITSITANFGTTIVGNIVYFQGGTGAIAAQWRQVTARASTTSITIDAAIAASTGMTMNIGGALASPGMASFSMIPGNVLHTKAGTYSITSASPNISAGCVAPAAGTYVEGYQTTRGDLGTPPLFQASGISTFTLFTQPATSGAQGVMNIRADGAGLTSSRAFLLTDVAAYKLTAENCTNSGFTLTAAVLTGSAATGCATTAAVSLSSTSCMGCVGYSNTITAFASLTSSTLTRCLAYANSGASTDGITLDTACAATNCVAYGNGRDGYRTTDDQVQFVNCIAEGNAAFGYTNTFGTVFLFNCAGFNNTSGNTSLGAVIGVRNIGFITGSATFFTNAAGGDFSLNTTAGGGAAARAAGVLGVFPVGLTTGFLDVGAAQHADPAGSGGLLTHPGMSGGMRA